MSNPVILWGITVILLPGCQFEVWLAALYFTLIRKTCILSFKIFFSLLVGRPLEEVADH